MKISLEFLRRVAIKFSGRPYLGGRGIPVISKKVRTA
jgi:hypothetical protein